jgi:hypothetical protein
VLRTLSRLAEPMSLTMLLEKFCESQFISEVMLGTESVFRSDDSRSAQHRYSCTLLAKRKIPREYFRRFFRILPIGNSPAMRDGNWLRNLGWVSCVSPFATIVEHTHA